MQAVYGVYAPPIKHMRERIKEAKQNQNSEKSERASKILDLEDRLKNWKSFYCKSKPRKLRRQLGRLKSNQNI